MNDTVPHTQPRAEADDAYRYLGAFAGGILAVGTIRFVLTVSGVNDSVTRWASMTAVIAAGLVYFAWRSETWKQRLRTAYVLIAPYMLVETAALGYTWASGNRTIFHAEPYTLGTSIPTHFWGHIVGGLTWEPWSVFLVMCVLAWVFRKAKRRH